MLNLILSRARATELEARVRAIDTQRRRADRAAAAAKMATSGPAPVTQGGEPRFWILFAR
jgi:hypothetical protein